MRLLKTLIWLFVAAGIVLIICGALVDDGVIISILISLLDIFPFGKQALEIAVKIVAGVADSGFNASQYKNIAATAFAFNLFRDVGVLALTALAYEALTHGVETVYENSDLTGAKKTLHLYAAKTVAVIVSTVLGTYIFSMFASLLPSCSNVAQVILSLIVSAGIIGGLAAVLKLVMELSIAGAALYAVFKVVALGVLKIMVSYIAIFVILICINEKAWLKMSGTIGGWLVVIIMLVGIETMLEDAIVPNKQKN